MKELTIEEKAKRYDQAIERAKDQSNKCCLDKIVLEEIFPELKDSDDERIRKALIELVHDTTGDSLWVDYNVHKEDALAWLEKQGDNMGISEATKQKLEDSLNGALGKETPESWNEFLDEQKSADKIEPKFKINDKVIHKETGKTWTIHWYLADTNSYYVIDEEELINHYSEDVLESAEQKFTEWTAEEVEIIDWLVASFDSLKIPTDTFYLSKVRPFLISLRNKIQPIIKEWSEEDEKMRNRAIKLISPDNNHSDYAKYKLQIVEWIKSLKDRVQPQPKQEWSEEDSNMLQSILDEYKSMAIEKRNWLKSLKDRYTWKPSERQKEALLWCVVHLGGADKQTLGELLEALNKL